MSGPKYRDWILETIDQLRKRKARPDLERICHMVERRYGLTFLETEHDIEKLVEEEAIIKVDYKGSTSYRNAAKWRRNHFGVPVSTSSHFLLSDKICNAVRQLNKSEFTNGEKGANITDIENSLVSISQESQLLKSHLQIYLQREIHCGRLKKLPNGNFVIAQPRFKQAKMKTAHAKSTSANPIPSKRGRPPTKRKRFKKSHGPDFESYSVTKAKTDEKCDYCLMNAKSNVNGRFEELLVCKDCNAKAHPSCMDYSEVLAKRAHSSPWQCIDCKTCYVCEDSGEADAMLFCDACDKGYHMSCHDPALFDKPTGQWVCSQCQLEDSYEEMASFTEAQSADGAGTSCLPTPSASPEHSQDDTNRPSPPEKKKAKHGIPMKPKKDEKKYPDASNWSIDDVIKFFDDTGFSEQSHVFREQEIDGKSLLLMKRSDVLTGLSLKLGPALKIYTHVQKLQISGP